MPLLTPHDPPQAQLVLRVTCPYCGGALCRPQPAADVGDRVHWCHHCTEDGTIEVRLDAGHTLAVLDPALSEQQRYQTIITLANLPDLPPTLGHA